MHLTVDYRFVGIEVDMIVKQKFSVKDET